MNVASPAIADVLLPLKLEGPYSYCIPSGMVLAPGDYVVVPLGPRAMIGVVWALRHEPPEGTRLRDVMERLEMAPMGEAHRKFIDWCAAYYLEAPGNVLRMALRSPEAFGAPREQRAYRASGAPPKRLTPQRARVLEAAREGFAMRAGELAQAAGVGVSVVKAMAKDGSLEEVALPALQSFNTPNLNAGGFPLSRHQERAAQDLRAIVASRSHKVVLLDGVTGSGKTEVYFEAMAAALAAGAQVLLLLPEIALTATILLASNTLRRRAGAMAFGCAAARARARLAGVAEARRGSSSARARRCSCR